MEITNLSIRHEAADLAFTTVNDSSIAVDQSCAERAAALQYNDAQYQQFKRDVNVFRSLYLGAVTADAQAAARAEALAKRTAPKPAAPVANPAPAAPTPNP